ncbi:MAG: hypothetical protein COV72_00945 [Candidatus Omnitrophica bacterium CG11_big_fil_rev_8_21_14_0_20_42_13]|uniref:Response regulatory domain-containing protein n=1 Tax=Candidatus Ghiorseimicrobium undicola TaxID=1974746 RepID=A0A2H0M1U5_9BACT|nr:MAG: hypothetical protein COV72_00945 [Candidatus Omnitrophica bacterium CG11_big_fil_rev_8_21_14_0_20_42_13]
MAKSILIIDDDKLVLMTVKRLLALSGYSVCTALNARAAFRRLKEASFDLIISDIKMPRMNGIETVKRIRQYLLENRKARVPEIFITAYASDAAYQEALALNVAGYIKKPFDVRTLQETVKKAMGENNGAKENINN